MAELLLDRPAPYLGGLLIGLVVVGLAATLNQRLGLVGGYSDLVDRVARRAPSLGWKAYFLFGIVAGSLLFSFLAGSWRVRSATAG